MMYKKFIKLFRAILFIFISVSATTGQGIVQPEKVFITLSDGVKLASDLYTLHGDKQLPVILIRSPYGKKQYAVFVDTLAQNNYIVIVQDVRGTGESEGIHIPFMNETKDGLETLNWIKEQKWYNGKIGMWGSSYLSFCSGVLASTNTPLLNSVFSISGGPDMEKSIMPGGTFHLMMNMTWMHFMKSYQDTTLKKYNIEDLMNSIPLNESFDKIGCSREIDLIGNGIKELSNLQAPKQAAFLHMTGWYDFSNILTFELYNKIGENSVLPNKIIVGPWRHDQIYRDVTATGDEDFGAEALMGLANLKKLIVNWFNYSLKGMDNDFTNSKDVKLFIMGKNQWEEFDNLKPGKKDDYALYLSSSGNANSSQGDGKLVLKQTNELKHDEFIFDPLNPVPTYGGALFHFFPKILGVQDQSEIETRNDVLVYTTDALKEPVKFTGPVKVELYVSTEGISTDFTAKLVELKQNGYAKIICDGIFRLSNNIIPVSKDIYQIEIDMGNVGIEIPSGNCLRLEVSSSNFPKYDRNPNNGENPLFAKNFKSVKQTIYHGGKYPSKIILKQIIEN